MPPSYVGQHQVFFEIQGILSNFNVVVHKFECVNVFILDFI